MTEVTDLATRTAIARKTDVQQLTAAEELITKAYQLTLGVTDSTYDGTTYREIKRINALLSDAGLFTRRLRIAAARLREAGADRVD